MRLCGISSRFQLLSPCTRQVTHALLTRPPLSHKIINPEGNQIKCFVRLACVKHAASVHPEPGSNSHVKKLISVKLNLANSFIQVANKFATVRSSSNNSASRLFSSLSHKFWIYCFKGLQFSLKRSDWFSKSFKVSHCSVINVLCFALLRQLDYFIKSLFVCQALFYFLNFVLSSLSCDSLFILSKCFSFVKNFFVLFCISVLRQKKAQGVGFEPTRPCGQTVFKTASLWPLRYPCVSQLILNCLVVCTCSAQDLYYHQCYNMSTLISIFFTFFCVSLKKVLQSPYLQELWPLYFHTSPLWALLLCHSHTLLSLHHP